MNSIILYINIYSKKYMQKHGIRILQNNFKVKTKFQKLYTCLHPKQNALLSVFNQTIVKCRAIQRPYFKGSVLLGMAFFGPSLFFHRKPKPIENESPVYISPNVVQATAQELRKKNYFMKLMINIYEAVMLFLRGLRLSCTFIPIFLLYPVKYFGSSFEELWWKLLLAGIEFSGPIFIKFGQWASTRRDLFPENCCNQFTRLQRRTSPHSWHYTKQQLSKAFGKNWRKVFVKFENDANPIGSGCIAQVYKVWIDECQIQNKDVLHEIIEEQHEHDDHGDRMGFIDDGLEVLGFRHWTKSLSHEKAEQEAALAQYNKAREDKRKLEKEKQWKEEQRNTSHIPHNIEDVTKELAQEIVCHSEKPEILKEKVRKGNEDEIVEHALVEQWQMAPASLEKGLPVVEDMPLNDMEGLVPLALKVLHPMVYTTFCRDMSIMRTYARLVTFVAPSLQWLSLEKCVAEFFYVMEAQIDMRTEASNLERFIEAFGDVDTIRFPRPVRPFVTRRVLTETFEEGEPMINFITEEKPDAIKKNLALIGVDALLKMIFRDNFTHGDLHPGNMLVQNESSPEDDKSPFVHDGNSPRMMMVDVGGDTFVMNVTEDPRPLRICILDCGIVTKLKQKDLNNFRAVFKQVILGDGESVANLFLENSEHECKNPDEFRKDMADIVIAARSNVVSLEQVDVGLLLQSVFSLVLKHRIRLESAFSSVVLAVFVLEGLGRSLDPQMDILERARPLLIS